MPKLSVVVPVYNVENYLNQCIDSILGQSFTDFELIIINDGSTDSSGIICDKYASLDPRVRVIHTENRGVVTARKIGVERANGEYATFVDSDDWLDLDFYSCIFEKMDREKADILICGRVNRAVGCARTTEFDFGYYGKKELENIIFPRMIYDLQTQKYQINPSIWNKIFRTELLKQVYEEADATVTLGEDAICTYPCIARASSLLIIDNSSCYNYREDHSSMINHCDTELFQRVLSLANNINRQFSELPSIFDSQVQCFVAYNALYAAHQILLYNRELNLFKRVDMARDFFSQDVISSAFKQANSVPCSGKFKYKLHLAMKKHSFLLYLIIKLSSFLHKL